MAVVHYESDLDIQFMGRHPGKLIADIDWDENNEGPLWGEASMKMLKTFVYPYMDTSHATRDPDGSIHAKADLPSHFGNGSSIKATIEVDPDGNITGQIPLLKGIVLKLSGKLK